MATAKADARKTSKDTVVVEADAATRNNVVDADVEINLSAVRRPLYAYVGAADFAVEKLRELPVVTAQRVQAVSETVKQAQGELPDKARALYSEFIVRGQKLVGNVRNNPAANAAVDEAKAAVGEAKDSATHAKRAAKAGNKAAEDTASQVG